MSPYVAPAALHACILIVLPLRTLAYNYCVEMSQWKQRREEVVGSAVSQH